MLYVENHTDSFFYFRARGLYANALNFLGSNGEKSAEGISYYLHNIHFNELKTKFGHVMNRQVSFWSHKIFLVLPTKIIKN